MDAEQYSLSNLRDIFIPDAPPMWPLAPGVWVLLCVVLALLLFVRWRLLVRRKRNAYREAGIELLNHAATVHDVSVVLKRVALAVFPREKVASLYGDDWATFLHRTCPRKYFLELISADASAASNQELVELADIWIRHHRVPVIQTPAASR